MTSIVVFGAAGQLGQCLKKVASLKCISSVVFLSGSEANILDTGALSAVFEKYKPGYVINCAAYTAVDKAEDETEQARAVNKTGAENLAVECKTHGAVLIQISTDFVFKGDKPQPLVEDDNTEPISVYGLTKLEGVQRVAAILPQHYIIRTSWLYSEFAGNFVKTMLKLGAERDELKIIADQVGTPTYAVDLAAAIFDIIASSLAAYGIYHYSNEGVASWYDFAKVVFDLSETQVKVYPIRTGEYPTKATRPAFSVMDKTKIKNAFGLQIPYWRDSLTVCIKALQSQQ
jgi:dTDP-4-dehydrorhamnose reductase